MVASQGASELAYPISMRTRTKGMDTMASLCKANGLSDHPDASIRIARRQGVLTPTAEFSAPLSAKPLMPPITIADQVNQTSRRNVDPPSSTSAGRNFRFGRLAWWARQVRNRARVVQLRNISLALCLHSLATALCLRTAMAHRLSSSWLGALTLTFCDRGFQVFTLSFSARAVATLNTRACKGDAVHD